MNRNRKGGGQQPQKSSRQQQRWDPAPDDPQRTYHRLRPFKKDALPLPGSDPYNQATPKKSEWD